MTLRPHVARSRVADTCTTPVSDEEWRDNPNEVWRIVPSWPDYAASSWGRLRRETPSCRSWPGRVMNIHYQKESSRNPYPVVGIYRNGKSVTCKVHRLVAEAFLGPVVAPLNVVDHLDSNPKNNRPDNLEYVTDAENARRTAERGRTQKGDAHYWRRHPELVARGEQGSGCKTPLETVQVIRQMLAENPRANCRKIARICSVGPSVVYHIKWGNTWKHLGDKAPSP